MVLEATVVCLDNSEWMRNGDYTPSRLEAQQDAVNLICSAKTQSNPESTVAVIACAGKSPEVLVTLTSDIGKVLSSLHSTKIHGILDFVSGLQVAQLALKHRQNKNQHQRVVAFVGSPLASAHDDLVRLGKRLKKNNVAVDIVNFGEEASNTEKLEAFINAVNSNDNSHLVTVPPGPHILSDILLSSPVINEGASAGTSTVATGGTAASDFGGYGGVDPNMDPELALALKVSMEEERARQEAEAKKKSDSSGTPTPAPTSTTPSTQTTTTPSPFAPSPPDVEMSEVSEEDELLRQALAMSMTPPPQTSSPKQQQPAPIQNTKPATSDAIMADVDDDDELQKALQMSLTEHPKEKKEEKTSGAKPQQSQTDVSKAMEDPNFVNSVLMTLPGVDPNDPRIKSVLASLSKPSEKKDEKDKDKDKK